MKLVFMGTPDYAVNTLEALIKAGHEVAGVFAQPDKPVGRKHILTPPPVKVAAIEHGIPVFQPNTLKTGETEEILKEINPDAIVVVAYGKILPEIILNIPKYGCLNGHASLLPYYRGSAPIQWAIINGEKITGVTVQKMDKGIDTGDILKTVQTEIDPDETAEELFERLSVISAELMVNTLCDLENGKIAPIKQDETKASYAPMINKEMAELDFKNKTANEIHNAVRGFYSWPCAFFFYDNKRIKVIKTAVGENINEKAGSVIKSDNCLIVSCKDNTSIELLEVQPEGSKAMSAKQMLCGKTIPVGTVLEIRNA